MNYQCVETTVDSKQWKNETAISQCKIYIVSMMLFLSQSKQIWVGNK